MMEYKIRKQWFSLCLFGGLVLGSSVTASSTTNVLDPAEYTAKAVQTVAITEKQEIAEVSLPTYPNVSIAPFTDPSHVGCPICGETEGHKEISDYFLAEEEALLDRAEGIHILNRESAF